MLSTTGTRSGQVSVFTSCCCTSAWHTGLQSDGGPVTRVRPVRRCGQVYTASGHCRVWSSVCSRGGPVAAFLLGESWPLEAAGAEKVEVSQWHCHVSGALKFPDDVAEWKQ